ncbi:MAG TPA: anthranilate phosphoribosyltransferase, partial [Myxococcaceae bacterium]|nr:anthranilate phosphoribosyltransferase [Myxococcaceae bacterium]
EVKGNSLREFQVVPEEAGLRRWPLEALRGGDAEENARILREVFSGRAGAHRDAVLLNAAAGLIVGERATNLCEGVELASRAVDTGAAMRTLQQLAQATQEAR